MPFFALTDPIMKNLSRLAFNKTDFLARVIRIASVTLAGLSWIVESTVEMAFLASPTHFIVALCAFAFPTDHCLIVGAVFHA